MVKKIVIIMSISLNVIREKKKKIGLVQFWMKELKVHIGTQYSSDIKILYFPIGKYAFFLSEKTIILHSFLKYHFILSFSSKFHLHPK